MAARQRVDLQRENQTHHRIRQRFADARRVREQKVPLQELEFLRRYAGLREQAEAGIDAVSRIADRDDFVDQRARRSDATAVRSAEMQVRGLFVELSQHRQRQLPGAQVERAGHVRVARSGSIIGKSRPCSRAQSMAIW